MNALLTLCTLCTLAFASLHPSTLPSCLLDKATSGTLDKVLTPEVLASVLPNRPAPTKKYITKYVPAGYQLCQYSWKGARETSLTVNGQTSVVTKPDVIALGNVRASVPEELRPKLPAIDLSANDLPGKTAVWDSTNSELIIYDDAIQYSIRVDIDNDVKKNQKVAVELLGKLKCE